jgi:hypothetical protein
MDRNVTSLSMTVETSIALLKPGRIPGDVVMKKVSRGFLKV